MRVLATLLATCALAAGAPRAAADTVADGFDLTTGAVPSPFSFNGTVTATLSTGDVITFDGKSVDRWTANGAFVMNLGILGTERFTAWVVRSPDESEVIFADSGSGAPGGDVWRAAVDGSGLSHVVALRYGFDAEFLPDGRMIATADLGNGGNDIVLIDVDAGTATPIGFIDGPSGPIAVRSGGRVFYANGDFAFPSPPGSTEILSWTWAQVDGGTFLDENNATVFASGYDGGFALAADPIKGGLLLAENVYDAGFQLLSARVLRVYPGAASFDVVAEADAAIGALEIVNTGGGAANFRAYQPSTGSNLYYNSTDFATMAANRNLIAPRRPQLGVSGAGTTGIGAVTLTLTDGVPNGTMFLVFAPQDQMTPSEMTYQAPNYLWHTHFAPGTGRRMGFHIGTDANGDGSFTFWNPGSLLDLYGYQMLVGDALGVFVGSSNDVTF